MLIILIILISAYSMSILKLTAVWNGIKSTSESQIKNRNHFFSIIIPIRNEASNIKKTLSSVLNNDFDEEKYEVLVVNDHSEDDSVTIVENISKKHNNVKLINLNQNTEGKKQAITLAISKAQGDIILCTDGDCEVPLRWIQNYADIYAKNKDLQLIFGAVKYNTSSFLSKILQMELSGLVGIGASTSSIGIPSMINGANFSYKKDAFIAVKGYQGNEQIPSGDDEFLLRKIFKMYPQGISFLKEQEAIVTTSTPDNIQELLNQRKRWAGKWKMHKDIFSWFIPFFVFSLNLTLLMAYYMLIFKFDTALLILILKPIADLIFLKTISKFYDAKFDFMTFLTLEFIYPFYVVFFGIASNFGTFTWKKRRF